MSLDRLGYEIKLRWTTLILTPLLIMAGIGLVAVLLRVMHKGPMLLLLTSFEMFLPLAAGVIVGSTLAQEPALELQLTMPRKYHRTGLLRVGLIFSWSALIALLCISGLGLAGAFEQPPFTRSWPFLLQFLLLQLVWLAPLLWFTAVGFCLSLLTNSRTATGALLGVIWMIDFASTGFILETGWLRPILLFPTFTAYQYITTITLAAWQDEWLVPRFEVLATAIVLLPLGWLLLHNTERLLQGSTEE